MFYLVYHGFSDQVSLELNPRDEIYIFVLFYFPWVLSFLIRKALVELLKEKSAPITSAKPVACSSHSLMQRGPLVVVI